MQTARARLRRLRETDLDTLQRLESNELVMRYTSSGKALTREESQDRLTRWLARDDGDDGIWLAETFQGDLIGWFMLRPNEDGTVEIGFMILQELWSQGFTTEIAARLMDHARPRVVVARVHPSNGASLKVLSKLGFREVRTEGGTVHLVAGSRKAD